MPPFLPAQDDVEAEFTLNSKGKLPTAKQLADVVREILPASAKA